MNIAIILAAGKSTRFGSDKPFVKIDGKPMILHSLDAFKGFADKIIIVANKENARKIKKLLYAKNPAQTHVQIILGGKTRQESVLNAIKFLKKLRPAPSDLIIIHNVANPFVTQKEIHRCIALAKKHDAAVVGNLASDTVKVIEGGFIKQTLPREKILLAQTPQIFKWKVLSNSYKNAKIYTATDDASIIESAGHKVAWTKSSYANKKITFTKDTLRFAPVQTRIGIASDYHEFSNSGVLTLAGVKFPRYKKLQADSDGDAIFHALAAAISSALGGGSLGTFAATMCKNKIKNSQKYLAHILDQTQKRRCKISNISINIETQKIKIDPLAKHIRENLSRKIHIAPKNIGITAIRGKSKNGLYCTAAVILITDAAL